MATSQYDVAVIGAGAAGMMAASVAGQRGLRVVLIDHAKKLGEKIRISGGGAVTLRILARPLPISSLKIPISVAQRFPLIVHAIFCSW